MATSSPVPDRRRAVRNDTPQNRRAVRIPPALPSPDGRYARVPSVPEGDAPRACAPDSYTSMCASGKQFWPLDPRAEDVDIRDIARALSMQCRWGGHVNRFFSVAQHCILVARHLPADMQVRGLLHDAAEAYIVDVPSPIKKYLHGYDVIEMRLLEVIGERFGVKDLHRMPGSVHEQDGRALATEHRDVRRQLSFWTPPAEPWAEVIVPLQQATAEKWFLSTAERLGLR